MPELTVPGAVLHYETFGSEGPLLVLIPGAQGHGAIFHPSAKYLGAKFTVVCWDRRGYSKSHLAGSQDFERRLQTDADDAQLLINHLSSDGTAIVFGTSSGAIVAQQLLASHPECVTQLISHEPPSFTVLPEEHQQQALGFMNHIYNTYRSNGPEAAMNVFTSGLSAGPESELMRQAMNARLGDETRANCLFWFEFELRQYPGSKVDVKGLTANKEKLILVAGEDSGDGPGVGPTKVIAAVTGKEVLRLPGGHIGYTSASEPFAEKLLELLCR